MGTKRTETRPGGVSIVRTPDSAGRLDTVAIPGGLVDYDYFPPSALSGAGKVSSIAGPYGVDLSFTYDGSLTTSTTWSGDVTGSVAWQYNNDFQKILETVNGATGTASTRFGYDNDLLLTCASPTTCSPPGADALRLTRHPQHGMVTGITLGQTSETWSYNAYGELARQTATFNGSPMVDIIYDEAGFERDALGRIVRKTETILGITKVYEYRYDALRRLDQVKIDGVVDEEFTYDANGNRLTAYKAGVGTVTATYDDQDRLLTYGTYVFTYTANGELETKTNTANGDEWLFEYDALGNLVSVGLPNGDLVEYLVDGMGQRVGKKVNGTLTKRWLYDRRYRPAAELDASGHLVAQFVYGSKRYVPDYVHRGGATYRVISDQLGSPRYVENVANSSDVPYQAHYGVFGQVTGTGLDWMPFGFAGGSYDLDTDVVRFGHRDFDPRLGRWISKEPLRFHAARNFYVYAFNDPVNWVDPSGLAPNGAGGTSGNGGEGGGEGAGNVPGGSDDPWVEPADWCGSGWSSPIVPEGLYGADFGDACRHHDECYSGCGSSKQACDIQLAFEIGEACRAASSSQSMAACFRAAEIYYHGVTLGGGQAFNNAQSGSGCECR